MNGMRALGRHLAQLRESGSLIRSTGCKRDPIEIVNRVRLSFTAPIGGSGEGETPAAEGLGRQGSIDDTGTEGV